MPFKESDFRRIQPKESTQPKFWNQFIDALKNVLRADEVAEIVNDAIADSPTVTGAVSSAVSAQVPPAITAEMANRSLLEGPTLVNPVLVLRPGASANSSGTVTPTTVGSPGTIAGTYGTAWNYTATSQRHEIANAGYMSRTAGTVIVRGTFTATLADNQNQQLLSGPVGPAFRVGILRRRAAGVTMYRFQVVTSVTTSFDAAVAAPDNTFVTLAMSWSGTTFRCYVNGVFVGSASFTAASSDTATIYTAASAGVYPYQHESSLFFTTQLPDEDIARLSALASAHTIATKGNLGIATIAATTTKFAPASGSGPTAIELRASDNSAVSIGVNPDKSLAVGGASIGGIAAQPSFAALGKNLYNPATKTSGSYLSEITGTPVVAASYETSDYIPVTAGVPYTVTQARKLILFDANRAFVSGQNLIQGSPQTVTPAVTGYARFSNDTANGAYSSALQFEQGATATTYESYRYVVPKLGLTTAQISGPASPGMNVTKAGETFTITRPLAGAGVLEQTTRRTGSPNGAFTFVQTTLDGAVIHNTSDDIAPIRLDTTVGGNHGYGFISRYTVAGHDKVTADLGSIWTDGTRQYTLLQISGSDLVFGNPYTVTGGVVFGSTTAPAATLTHVSGATHTSSVAITTPVVAPQLYPSINNISVKYFLDGLELTADGIYGGDVLRVVETYTVMDYKDIIDWAQAHIGQSYATGPIAGAARVSNTFTYRANGGQCTISSGLTALRKITLGDCGFMQAVALSRSGYTTYRYMPGVAAKSGVDFSALVDMTAYNTSITFAPADYLIAGQPPSRYVDWLITGSTKLVGFTMGYVTDKTNSKNTDRAALPYAWDMRNTKKSYPTALTGLTLNAGDHRNIEGYRNYIAPHATDATIANTVTDAAATYVTLDYHASKTAVAVQLPDQIGKAVTILQSTGLTVANDTVDADGLVVTVPGSSGRAIVKLT